MKFTALVLFVNTLILTGLQPIYAAQVGLVKNKVKSGDRSFLQGASLLPGNSLSTAKNSKTEVSIGQSGSLARAGSKTDLILKSDTTLALQQGIMLTSSGKRALGRETMVVETLEVKAAIKGTMLIAYQPGVFVKITCIEGTVTVKLKALFGEFVRLEAGQMVIIDPVSKSLPQAVEVDLRTLCATSSLMGSDFSVLGASVGLERAVTRQDKGLGKGNVVRTPLILEGAGLAVTLQTDQGVDPRRPVSKPSPQVASRPQVRPVVRTIRRAIGAKLLPALPPASPEYVIDGSTVFSGTSQPILQTPGYAQVRAENNQSASSLNQWKFPDGSAVLTPELLIRGQAIIPANSQERANEFISEARLQVGEGDPTSLSYSGSLGLRAGTDLDVVGASINSVISPLNYAGNDLTMEAGKSLTVRDSRLQNPDVIALKAPSVVISGSTLEVSGQIRGRNTSDIESNAIVPGNGVIVINDSSVLLALARNSALSIRSNGGPIILNNTSLRATTIDIDTVNQATDSLVDIRNSSLSGDTIRARAYNTGDRDAILIRDSTFNAGQLIRFYAEGSSRLRFQGNNNLNLDTSGVAHLAGRTVQVDSGGNVNIRGNGNVYRDVDNYNKTGYGNINISGSQSHQPYSARP